MSVTERLKLLEEIWESLLEEEEAVPLTDAQRKELDRRLEEYRAHPEIAISWEEFRRQLRRA
jgi:putative addiction module component (TIGR02574 family)